MRPIDADALIDKCGGWYVEEGTESGFIGTLKNILATMPTIQPVATDTNDGDAISRQAAIDAIDEERKQRHLFNTAEDGLLEARRIINTLTPVQPETAKRIAGKSRDGMTLWYQCDMCNEPVDEQDNYCRKCGRRLIDG